MESQQKQPDFLVGFAYNKDNDYLGEIIGVSGLFHPQTQLIDALIESSMGVALRRPPQR